MIPGLAVLVDASEQLIYRPQDDETQKKHYSGKGQATHHEDRYVTTYDGVIFQTSTAVAGKQA